ncbi:hypothetical protein [Nocardia arthritidis]|uniref:DUF2231 domain-containing protein n=1 Tax=Nocardia arthritidis TaxID=228602 RepID=A0A6G9YDU3_9NOCA|nr:hypothetical protein [Nocardia arthritidis]QIS11399.1 hypothetical protein F5544_17615 [Nocardia arthritidis]
MPIDVAKARNGVRARGRELTAPVAVAIAAPAAFGAAIWASTRIHAGPVLYHAALFTHLSSLVLGFGAVLVADYLAVLWLAGRCTLAEAVAGAQRLHLPIWLGLSGLVTSGMFLRPELDATATRIKLALVLILIVNGVQALALGRRMTAAEPIGTRLLVRGVATTVVSQLCWWGSLWIGFWTAQS